jgi:uncharacterized membrane protein YfhO
MSAINIELGAVVTASIVLLTLFDLRWSRFNVPATLVLVFIAAVYSQFYHWNGFSSDQCWWANRFSDRNNLYPATRRFEIPKMSRIAIGIGKGAGDELIATTSGYLTSAGRAVVMPEAPYRFFLEKGLVDSDEFLSEYHFRSDIPAKDAAVLAIKYLLIENGGPKPKEGWRRITSSQELTLYENEFPAPLAYLTENRTNKIFPLPLTIRGSELQIALNGKNGKLNLAFSNAPCLRATIDGKNTAIETKENKMIEAKIRDENRQFNLKFSVLSCL